MSDMVKHSDDRGIPPADAPESQVVERYQGLVQSIVQKVLMGLKLDVERDDLVAYGNMGLLQAWRRYDHGGKVNFSTYAYYRIRGAILDGCRKEGWQSRRRSERVQTHKAINDHLEEHYQSTAASQPPSQSLSESVDRVSSMVGNVLTVIMVEESDLEQVETSIAPRQDKRLEQKHENERLSKALAQLEFEERVLIKRHHYYGDSLTDIAKDLNKSKSWCSRMHARALERLRDILAPPAESIPPP